MTVELVTAVSPGPARFFDLLSFTLETRPNDLDGLGHVNNAVALEYLEAARWDWARRMDLPELGHVFVVVSHISIHYLNEILPGRVLVTTRFVQPSLDWEEASNYQAIAEQAIYEPSSGRELVRARVTVAFVDSHTRSLETIQSCLLGRAET